MVVFAIAALPLLVAVGMKLAGWHPTHTINYGQLIQPAKPLQNVHLDLRGGSTLELNDLRHYWVLLTFSHGACIGTCAQNIYKMRQVHVAQGKYEERVRRLLVVLPDDEPGEFAEMVRAYPQMKVATGPLAEQQALARQLKTPNGDALNEEGWIYVIDPVGNYMMRYPPHADPSGIRRDLARLLRVSQIG